MRVLPDIDDYWHTKLGKKWRLLMRNVLKIVPKLLEILTKLGENWGEKNNSVMHPDLVKNLVTMQWPVYWEIALPNIIRFRVEIGGR